MLTLNVPADSRYVHVARAIASAFLDNLGVVPDDVYDARLILGEACSSVVRHAYDHPGETYLVELALIRGGLAITVTDHGRGFDLEGVGPPNLGRPNGWGIWLVQHLS